MMIGQRMRKVGRKCFESRLVSLRVVPFFLMVSLLLLLVVSCATMGEDGTHFAKVSSNVGKQELEIPAWTADILTQDGETLFIIGGPAASLEEARNMAYSEISYMIKTDVYAVTEDYVNVSSNALDSYMEQQVTMTTRASTDSVLSGVRVVDTFEDVGAGQWWVRVAITESDMEQSKKDTIEQLARLQELFGQYRVYFTDTVKTLLTGAQPYVHQVRLAVSAMEELHKLPSYDALIVSDGLPRATHVNSFLTDLLQGAATTLSPKVVFPRTVERGTIVDLQFSTDWDFTTDWAKTSVKTG